MGPTMPPQSPAIGAGPLSSAYVSTTDAIQLAPELNSSITHILRSKDPLDAQEFSSVEYINKIFPNGTGGDGRRLMQAVLGARKAN